MFGLETLIAVGIGSLVGAAINSETGKATQEWIGEKAKNTSVRTGLAISSFFSDAEVVQAAKDKAAELKAQAKAEYEKKRAAAQAAKEAFLAEQEGV